MTATNTNKGQHYELIKSNIDPVYLNMSLQRSAALRNIKPRREHWMQQGHRKNHERLVTAHNAAWKAQNTVDKTLAKLQDVYSFARPLLEAKLFERLGFKVDVEKTFLRLYVPARTSWYDIHVVKGYATRTVSLLDAALHNFSYDESFETDSTFIIKTDPVRDLFDVSPVARRIRVAEFTALCRELDIGAQYKVHLESVLLEKDPLVRSVLRQEVIQSQKTALKAAAHTAILKMDISREAHTLVGRLLFGRDAPLLNGQVMQVCELGMMDLTLTGILIIRPDPDQEQHSQKVIAYVPHDPEHPLKEYPSAIEFMQELTRQLLENRVLPSTGISYRQFFSQFVDHEQRGHFFAGLQQRLSQITWHETPSGDARPSWRETPVEHPNLQFSAPPIIGSLWAHLYEKQLNKILNDARVIAVSTADADDNARWAWWENFKKIASDIFNVALMVLTPFVPGLGELMLAYTAYQLANDVIEGAVDLAEGLWVEGTEHFAGVVSDVVQLAAFAAGAKIGEVFKLKLSSFIEGTRNVPLSNGERRLWHPDITPYEHQNLKPPTGAKPDALGLHRHEGKHVLPLDDRHFVAEKTADQYRLRHPTRTDAYSPQIHHNGHGAWRVEGENPRAWDSAKLMKRLGHSTDGFSPRQLENLRQISGVEEDALRRMHTESTPPPPLLEDTLKRARAYADVDISRQAIRTGSEMDPSSFWFQQLVTELPGWPSDRALKVYERADMNGISRTYGRADASPEHTLSISLADVMAGKLPEAVSGFLDDGQMETLIGSRHGKDQQVQALRDRLADLVNSRKVGVADYIYAARETTRDPRVRLLQRQYPELPTRIAELLVKHSSRSELERLDASQRIPLDLYGRARESAFEVRAARAAEGLYQEDRLTADTERYALNVVRHFNSNAFRNLRIEVRSSAVDGPLRCSAGPDDAAQVKTLVRNEHGQYELHAAGQRVLPGTDDLYATLLQALPERTVRELGFLPSQGRAFRQWLRVHIQFPQERRTVLLEPSIRPVAKLETDLLLRGPLLSKEPKTIEQRVKDLYPDLSDGEIDTFIRSIPPGEDAAQIMTGLEQDLNKLDNRLRDWLRTQGALMDAEGYRIPTSEQRLLVERLLECFKRKPRVFNERSTRLEQGYTLDLSSDLPNFSVERHWRKLPDLRHYLDQVTTLNLDRVSISHASGGMLKNFLQLRHLSARNCDLTRLPESVKNMQNLETLRLSNNRIVLTEENVESLGSLTHMQTLRLDRNPLARAPDVTAMPQLKTLDLSDTGIDHWPAGVLSGVRPEDFFLDLQGNPIQTIPRVQDGSNEARIIAHTRLTAENLNVEDRMTLHRYRESVGLPRENAYAQLAEEARRKWALSPDSALWGKGAPGLDTYREDSWDRLMNEPGSNSFFRLIDHLTESADYIRGGKTRQLLAKRVWDMIDAMDLDSPLREELFKMVENPENCADASSEVFNTMGIKVLVSQVRLYLTTPTEREEALVHLAKGSARLNRVNDIARADSLSRPSRVEEVEIYLTYQTRLSQRLGLPWQSEDLLHEGVAHVTNRALDSAYDTVLEQEQGDGLVNGMIELDFWDQYLKERYPAEMEANEQRYNQKMDELEEQRSNPGNGEPMSDETYSDRVIDLAYERQQLARNMTRTLMTKHGL